MATEIETKPMEGVSSETLDTPSSPSSRSADKKRKAANADVPEIEVDLNLPEPPSKRAKRALKKGKTLPAKPKSDDEEEEDDLPVPGKPTKKGGKGGNNDEKKPTYGIWIGNLNFDLTRRELFQWFVDQSGGSIKAEDITRINLPLSKRPAHQQRPHNVSADANGKLPPNNKGFAYVDFATYEAQIAATALSETELNSRRVLIKDSKSFEGRPAKEQQGAAGAAGAAGAGADGAGKTTIKNGADVTATAGEGAKSTKVFVGNLGFDTTEEDLRRHFAPCGPVAWVKVATFPDNHEKCRGYGWVQFGGKTDEGQNVTPEEAGKAAAAAVTGFVRITETIDTEEVFAAEAAAAAAPGDEEEDNKDKDDGEETKEAAPAKSPAGKPRTRQRKWWVNMLKGRPLKVQFAEDDSVRYKKRFKGKPQGGDGGEGGEAKERRPRTDRPQGGKKNGGEYKHQDLQIASRTGAITESLGKRTILE
ncbi:Nucleolar protein 13 [Sporothrix bragantina]|uniref:Nucleolar protein 13 n=1 Tax=Sporothrix bragantina TaxID=671064 RepID=A0ABP0CQJ7_9PEZI